MKLIYFFLLLFLVYNAKSQQSEIKEIQQNKIKTYKSDGADRSKGLKFSINYPASYSLENVKNINVVKGFSSPKYTLLYMVGVVKAEGGISQQEKKNILSKENMQISVSSSTKTSKILMHNGGLKVNGLDAAYIEYNTKVNDDVNSYFRQYFIISNNYLVTLSFTVPQQANSSDQATKQTFNNYKKFFEVITTSFKVIP